MQHIREQRRRDDGRGALQTESYPQIPVRHVAECFVERADTVQQMSVNEYIRGARRDNIAPRQPTHAFRGRRRRAPKHRPELRIHHHGAAVRPAALAGRCGGELANELIRRPQIVVIQKGNPGPARFRDAAIARAAYAFGMGMPHESDPGVCKLPDHVRCRVVRAIVNDDNLETDIALSEHGAQRARQQLAAIASRNHDADRRQGVFFRRPMTRGIACQGGSAAGNVL